MPLLRSASRDAVSKNYDTERAAGKSKAQSLAVALSEQDRAKRRAKMWRGGKAEKSLELGAGVPYSDTEYDDFEDPDDEPRKESFATALLRRKGR